MFERREFQRGLDSYDCRRKRQNDRLSLRRKQRKDRLLKRRREIHSFHNGSLSPNEEQSKLHKTAKEEDLPKYREMVMSSNPELQLKGTKYVRVLLDVLEDPPVKLVARMGFLPQFVKFMKDFSKPQLQFHAAGAMAVVAGCAPEDTRKVYECGGMDAFHAMLCQCKDSHQLDFAIWGLGNLAGDSSFYADMLLEKGTLATILEKCKVHSKTFVVSAVWCVANLYRCGTTIPQQAKAASFEDRKDEQFRDFELSRHQSPETTQQSMKFEKVFYDGLPRLFDIFKECYQEYCQRARNPKKNAYGSIEMQRHLMRDILWCISYLVQKLRNIEEERRMQDLLVNKSSMLQYVVNLLSTNDREETILTPALRIVGNLVSGDNDWIVVDVIRCGFLSYDCYSQLLNHEESSIRKETCWSLSNISAISGPLQLPRKYSRSLANFKGLENIAVKYILENDNLLQSIIRVSISDRERVPVRKEAVLTLCNLCASCKSNYKYVHILIETGLINVFAFALQNMNFSCRDDAPSTSKHLDLLRSILEAIHMVLDTLALYYQSNHSGLFDYLYQFEESCVIDSLDQFMADSNLPADVHKQISNIVDRYWTNEIVVETPPRQLEEQNLFGIGNANAKNQQQFTFSARAGEFSSQTSAGHKADTSYFVF